MFATDASWPNLVTRLQSVCREFSTHARPGANDDSAFRFRAFDHGLHLRWPACGHANPVGRASPFLRQFVAMSRISLIDDHALLRDGLRLVLEKNGHQVIGEATDLTRGSVEVRELQPDVVVLDLHLGTRSGLELLEELQKRKSSTRCVVLTMSSQSRNVADCLRYGASAYLLKGGPPHELLVAIHHALTGRTYLGEGVSALMVALPPEGDGVASLSARERQIAVLVAKGHSSTDVGRILHLSPKTVDTYRSRLMAKLGTPDLPALVRYAMTKGLLEPE